MIMSVFKEKVTGDNENVGGGAVEVKSCGDGKKKNWINKTHEDSGFGEDRRDRKGHPQRV